MKNLIVPISVGVILLGALCAAPADAAPAAEEPCFAAHCDGKLFHFHAPGPFAIAVHSAAVLSLAFDISTAFDLKNHQHDQPYHLVEPNPLLGQHPGDGLLVGYFFGVAALQTALWLVLPEELRWIPDAVMLMIEVPQVAANRSAGLAFRLPF